MNTPFFLNEKTILNDALILKLFKIKKKWNQVMRE